MGSLVLREWVEALESGQYNQYAGGLHFKSNGRDSFCCLGVACDIADLPWDYASGTMSSIDLIEYMFSDGDLDCATLPRAARGRLNAAATNFKSNFPRDSFDGAL